MISVLPIPNSSFLISNLKVVIFVYILETDGLTKEYSHVKVVDGVSLKVEQGDIYGFVGAGIGYYNSSVKSTNESLTIMQKGMSAGAGIDVAYHNVVLGVYYKYTDMIGININWNNILVKTHNVGVKIGYRFAI